jgi:hypothetical protein
MAFTIKDTAFKLDEVLMAKMLPTEVKIADQTLGFEEWLGYLAQWFCIKRCSGVPCIVYTPPEWIVEAQAKLKDDLYKQLRAMKQIPEELLPQTVDQVDELKKKLSENLAQLETHRKALEKKLAALENGEKKSSG